MLLVHLHHGWLLHHVLGLGLALGLLLLLLQWHCHWLLHPRMHWLLCSVLHWLRNGYWSLRGRSSNLDLETATWRDSRWYLEGVSLA